MSTLTLRRKARALWPNSQYNQRAWLRAVISLGDKWLINKPINDR